MVQAPVPFTAADVVAVTAAFIELHQATVDVADEPAPPPPAASRIWVPAR